MKKSFLFIGVLILTAACNLPASQTQEATKTPDAVLTAPPISTPEPTFTPPPTSLPTATVPPTPVPLYFIEEFTADLGAWTFFQTGGEQAANLSVTNDGLEMQMNAPHSWQYAIHNAHDYESVYVSAKASGEPSGSLGLVCGYNPEGGWFEFNITHEGTFSVLKANWLADGIVEYKPILNETSEYLDPGKMDYEIGLTCSHNALFLQVNGKMFRKLDVSYIGIPPGKVGLSAASFDNAPMSARFEWFKVGAPEW